MKTIKLFILPVLLLIVLTGCKKDKTSTGIVGKWTLVKVKTVFYEPQEYYYSENNIIYQFRANGTLNVYVTGDISEYMGKRPGEYSYRVEKSSIYKETDVIVINNGSEAICSISGNNLTIDDSPLDGPIYYFTRVK
ncbi:lipocalin family protein [Pseudopedobacter beijingensis]|uniref:Lipocalin family protein n=1 Tax=Pseudopedobacter beijingensis TaxID=1207056 RepID=A0ABW4IFG3_9SPHI